MCIYLSIYIYIYIYIYNVRSGSRDNITFAAHKLHANIVAAASKPMALWLSESLSDLIFLILLQFTGSPLFPH